MISVKKAALTWNKFFFEEKPTEGIALFRIIWMSLIFCYYLLDLVNITDFYGPDAIISPSTALNFNPGMKLNLFKIFGSGYEVIYIVMAIFLISVLTSVLGLFTRTSLVIAFLCMTSFHQRNIWLLSSAELLMRTITIFLICSPCGHSLSIDSLLSHKKREWPVWALRLIQIQLSVVYLWTVWHKMKGDTWIEGTAVYYATRLEEMANHTLPYVMNSPSSLKLMTWSTLLIEFSLGFFIWFKELRIPAIITGIIFHLGIEYTMSIPFFELLMIALLINFFTPEELKAFVRTIKLAPLRLIKRTA